VAGASGVRASAWAAFDVSSVMTIIRPTHAGT
jgi:hypothetical protein